MNAPTPVQGLIEAVYPNDCHLCGLRLVDVDAPSCVNPSCPLKATVVPLPAEE